MLNLKDPGEQSKQQRTNDSKPQTNLGRYILINYLKNHYVNSLQVPVAPALIQPARTENIDGHARKVKTRPRRTRPMGDCP